MENQTLQSFLHAGRQIPRTVVIQIAGVLVLSLLAAGGTGSNASADNFNAGPNVDTTSAIVQLKGDPVSTYPGTRPLPAQKISFNSNAVQSYRAQLAAERNQFRQWLQANAPRVVITSQYDISLNAVAVQLNGTPLETIAAAPMVQQFSTTRSTTPT